MVTKLDPEISQLALLVGDTAIARKLARAPGGWRSLSRHELGEMKLGDSTIEQVLALQHLVQRSYIPLPEEPLNNPQQVAAAYDARLGDLPYEVLIALGLTSRHRLLGEVELSRGGAHAAALTPADVLRPLIRMGATGFIVLHNHPGGDPAPSREDLAMTSALEAAADIVGLTLLDHLVIGARGGGYKSLYEMGHLPRSLPSRTTVNDTSR